MSSRRSRFARFVVGLLLLVAPFAQAQTPVALSGRVIADETGQPVGDARVHLEGTAFVTVTDANGTFSFPNLPPATYALSVTRDGFETVRARVEVGLGSTPPLEVRLPFQLALREGITVVGRTVGELGLAGASTTASRLNLKAIDIPSSIDVLDSTVMEARGYQKVSDADRRPDGCLPDDDRRDH